MLKIEVRSIEVDIREGISQKTNKPYRIRSQVGYVFMPGEPYPIKINLDLGQKPPYEQGFYQLGIGSFLVGSFGRLQLSNQLDLQRQPSTASSTSGATKAA